MEIRLKHALAAVAVAASLQSALAQQGPGPWQGVRGKAAGAFPASMD